MDEEVGQFAVYAKDIIAYQCVSQLIQSAEVNVTTLNYGYVSEAELWMIHFCVGFVSRFMDEKTKKFNTRITDKTSKMLTSLLTPDTLP